MGWNTLKNLVVKGKAYFRDKLVAKRIYADVYENLPITEQPATTVVSETTYGQTPSVGTSIKYAREDHTHGTPPLTQVNKGCHITRTSNYTIPSATDTIIPFQTARYDTDNMFSDGRINISTAGKYIIGANVEWAFSDLGNIRRLRIVKNGSIVVASVVSPKNLTLNGGDPLSQFVCVEVNCSVDDYFEVVVFQDTTGNLNILKTDEFSPEFWARKVG